MSSYENMTEGQLKQMRGEIQAQYGDLTDQEWEQAKGNMTKLSGIIQEKFGEASNNVQSMLDDISSRVQH